MNSIRESLSHVHHGLGMALLALIMGALWAAYIATHHEQLHGGFEKQEVIAKKAEMKHHMQELDMTGMELGHAHAAGMGAHEHHEAAGGAMEKHQHSHSGSLAKDAMQRLLRGHIHFMGIGMLTIVMLILVAATTLKSCWKKTFGWTFGLGALLYPPAWILMGFRTVEFGPQGAEESVLWLFGPAVGLLVGSLIALFAVMVLESTNLKAKSLFSWAFER